MNPAPRYRAIRSDFPLWEAWIREVGTRDGSFSKRYLTDEQKMIWDAISDVTYQASELQRMKDVITLRNARIEELEAQAAQDIKMLRKKEDRTDELERREIELMAVIEKLDKET